MFNISEVFTHPLVSPCDWPNITFVDSESTTQAVHRESNGPLCTDCDVLLDTSNRYFLLLSEESDADEQWLPHKDDEVEQGFLHFYTGVQQRSCTIM